MAKTKNILGNRHKKNAEHLARTESFVRKVRKIFDLYNLKAAKLALTTDFKPVNEFKWADFPAIRHKVTQLTTDFANSLKLTVTNGIKGEWEAANNIHDDTLKRFFEAHSYRIQKKKGVRQYFEYNKDAVQNFIDRKTKGLSLSERLWNLGGEYKDELEAAIAVGIEKGTSAAQLSKKLSQYLNDFQSLKQDYSEKFGKQVDIKNCEYKAARLARTEINMSYREAEQQRWREEDFVVGYEIKRSGTPYPCPVCESLQGKYPKDFVWNGWHPNCRCYQVPILKTEEEFWANEGEEVTLPDNFKKWVEDNSERIVEAKLNDRLPQFVEDNENYVSYASKINEGSKSVIEFLDEFDSVAFSNEDGVKELILNLDNEKDSDKRLALMETLRTKAAEFTKRELEKSKAVEGLSYVGVEKGVVITERFEFVDKNGKIQEVPERKITAVCYKDELGKVYRYPIGMSGGQVTYKAADAAKFIKGLPDALKDSFDSINFNLRSNNADIYWADKYGKTGFKSSATASRNINFYGYPRDFERGLLHEIGHNYDNFRISSSDWKNVCKLDKKQWITEYSNYSKSYEEDFAESFALFYQQCVRGDGKSFKKLYPKRFEFLSNLQIWGVGRK